MSRPPTSLSTEISAVAEPADAAQQPSPATQSPAVKPPSGVLERGISILECFKEDRLRLSLRDLARLTGLDKATLLRLLGVLVAARMVHRFDNGDYAPGPALLHMGMLYRSTFDVGTRLQPVLHAVVRQTGETVAFYVRSGTDRICLYRENSPQSVRHHVEVGARIPLADGGASAHILKAFAGEQTPLTPQVLDKGYAMTGSERVPEMASVAVPVFDGDGSFLGSLVVIGMASRHTLEAQLKAVDVARRELTLQGFAARPPKDWRPPAP